MARGCLSSVCVGAWGLESSPRPLAPPKDRAVPDGEVMLLGPAARGRGMRR